MRMLYVAWACSIQVFTFCQTGVSINILPPDSSSTTLLADTLVTYPLVPPARSFFSTPSYRISVGAGFDFIHQLKPAQIYGELIIDVPDILQSKKAKSGFLGGIYQLRYVAIDSFIPDKAFLTGITPIHSASGHGDSSIVRISSAKGRSRLQLDNLYFFASLYRPWQQNHELTGRSGLYHLFRIGSIRSKVIIEEQYERTTNDTVFITINPDYPLLPLNKQTQEVTTYWELGYGQMLRHEFDDLALQVNLMGLFFPKSGDLGYILSLNAVGTRSGLVIGAEIRTEPLLRDQLYNVFLAKTIRVKDLTKLITTY